MNYVSIVVAAIAAMVVGFVWFSVLFGKEWARQMGKSELDMKMDPMTIGMGFIGVLVMAFVLDVFLLKTNAIDMMGAVKIAGWAWLGFTATMSWSKYVWGTRSIPLFLIDAGHNLVAMVVMAAALVTLGV